MAKNEKKEVIVIGAGPGGYAAAFRAADLGLKVCLIDPEVNPGGVCLYRGCIPSKALLHLAKVKREAEAAAERGLKFGKPEVDLKKMIAWKTQVVEKLTGGLGQLSKSKKIEYIKGEARFLSKNELEVKEEGGKTSKRSFEHAIIATGSYIAGLPGIELDHKKIIDSTDALEIEELPKKLLVIGGGYIGLELGSFFAAMGSKVSVAEMTPGFLPGADRDLVKILENAELFENTWFETKVEKASVEKSKVKVSLKNEEGTQEKTFDKVLVAVGRKPYSASFDPEKAGIETDDKGFIRVDLQRRTNIKNIYAIGDLTGEPLLAHKATHEGRVAAEVIAGEPGAAYDVKAIPGIVFTDPELAWTGLTQTEAKEKGMKVKLLKFPWRASGRAVSIAAENGLTKLIVDPDSGRILGGGVAGKNAGSLIPEITLAIEMAATAEDLALTIHPHPTLSETLMEAAESFSATPTHFSSK
ncbi:MAG: dihydrolipoyl dehydrogenase [Salegentibacter sp.]